MVRRWQQLEFDFEKAKKKAERGHCVECGATDDLYDHHVVPKSKGGTFTVRLCGTCHHKIHEAGCIKISRLTSLGLKKVQMRGKRLGAPKMWERREPGGKIVIDIEKLKLVRFVKCVNQKHPGLSFRDLQGHLNALGVRSPLKRNWHLRSISTALKSTLPKVDGVPESVALEDLHPDFRKSG